MKNVRMKLQKLKKRIEYLNIYCVDLYENQEMTFTSPRRCWGIHEKQGRSVIFPYGRGPGRHPGIIEDLQSCREV